jgi:hypothetical protein
LLTSIASDDIFKARVATLGPEVHTIVAEDFNEGVANRLTIYDVGGSRNQRGMATLSFADISGYLPLLAAAWAQFFDDGV